MKTLHIVTFTASFALIIASVTLSAVLFSSLPSNLPFHFGVSGAPDSWVTKDILSVMMIPMIQLALFLFFLLIYKHPQYSSWPTTLILMTVSEDKREKVFDVLRGMMVGTMLVVNLLFLYLQFVIFATANGRLSGVSPYAMIAFLAVLFGTIIFYSARMLTVVKKISKK